MIPPVNSLFNQLQEQKTVTVWLYEQLHFRIRGKIAGFDEFMNIVLDDAEEIPLDVKTGKQLAGKTTKIGRMLLKGDNITLVTSVEDSE
ncbi:hypothetical protein ACO0RG_004000 [Hanseniaspora osmophila]